jgi:hypothetical protein
MHKPVLSALAVATLFAIAMPLGSAGVQAPATPSVAQSSLVHEALIVCGGNGCNPVHTRVEKRQKFKPLEYTKPVRKAS